MKDISAMETDLRAASEAHMASVTAGVNTAAARMAAEAKGVSSPMYGVSVASRSVDIPGGKKVEVLIQGTEGPGKVFGGQAAVRAQVIKVMDAVAREDGLDRRR